MPRPPQVDDLTEISFITNYFLQGCKAPFSLFVEFSREPRGDLFVLLLGFDFDDIVKDWLRPGGGRRRAAGRHGRKRRRLPSLDPNEYVGGRARANYADMYPGIKLPGAKAVFFIGDQFDRLNFTAAVLEGVTDIGFETLWGMIQAHPELCPGFAYVDAANPPCEPFVGVAPPQTPLHWDIINNSQNFQGPNPFTFTTFVGDFTASWAARVQAVGSGDTKNFRLTIRSDTLGILGESSAADIALGESINLAVEAEVPEGEFVYCARSVDVGSVEICQARLVAFSGTKL